MGIVPMREVQECEVQAFQGRLPVSLKNLNYSANETTQSHSPMAHRSVCLTSETRCLIKLKNIP